MPCKPGKEKNANGRCVKIKTICKAGKEKNKKTGRCVKICKPTQHRNAEGKCVTRTRKNIRRIRASPASWGQSKEQKYGRRTEYKKPLPISPGKFRGKLIVQNRRLRSPKSPTSPKKSSDDMFGHWK